MVSEHWYHRQLQLTMDFNGMSTNSRETVSGGRGSLKAFTTQVPGSVDHGHPNASELHVHPDRTIESGISYSRANCVQIQLVTLIERPVFKL
jgi:hypothetical protein